jgi:hypothetical protein
MTKNTVLYNPEHLRWTGQVKEMNKQSVDETGGNLEDRVENWALNFFLGVRDKTL